MDSTQHSMCMVELFHYRGGKMGKPLKGNKKKRKHARRQRRIDSVSRFKKASKGM